jgi:hypothetical protein
LQLMAEKFSRLRLELDSRDTHAAERRSVGCRSSPSCA